MEQKMNIYQRMSAISEELRAVAKNLQVGEGRSKYKATGEADILAAVKPLEAKYGVYSYPVHRDIINNEWQEIAKTYNGQTTVTKRMWMRIAVDYCFINIDDPEDFIEIRSYGDGIDTADKAPGKAMTYADKYALMKGYKIITGEDPDQFASDEPFGEARPPKETAPKDEAVKASPNQIKVIGGYPPATRDWALGHYGVNALEELTKEQATELIKAVSAKKAKQEAEKKAAAEEAAEELRDAFEG